MENVRKNFINGIEKRSSNLEIDLGTKIYNLSKEICLKDIRKKTPIILHSFLKISEQFFCKYFEKNSAECLIEMAREDILNLEKKVPDNQYNFKFRLLTSMLNKTIFTVYKNNLSLTLKEDYLKRNLYKNYKNIIDASKEESKDFFIDFDFLSRMLEASGVSAQNSYEIILSFIKKNIELYNKQQINPIPDINKIKKHKFKKITKKEIDYILNNNMINEFLSGNYPKKKVKELKTFIENNPLDISNYVKNCRIILKNYENSENLTEANIYSISLALLDLDIDEKLCRKIELFLNKKYIIGKKEKINKPIQIVNEVKEVKMLSKKQTNLIIKQLNQYFDFERMRPIKYLTLNEIIYCISLMKKINADEKSIENFLKLIEKENRKQNPVYLYANLYNKLMFYKDKKEIVRILNDIENELQKMFICSSDDYDKIKSFLNENIKYALNYLANNYEYEKNEAKKMLFEK